MTWLMALVDSVMSYSLLTQPLPVSACVMLPPLYPHRPLHSAGKNPLLTYSRPLEYGSLSGDTNQRQPLSRVSPGREKKFF